MKEKFLQSYREFLKRIPASFEPKNIDKWYDDVLSSKQAIRQYIPNASISLEVELSPEETNLSTSHIDPYIDPILKIIPTYLSTYALTKQHLTKSSLSTHKGISTAKHILTFVKKQKIETEKIRIIEKHLSELGQVYAKGKFSHPVKRITLTYDPLAFIMLGNFSFDSGSCFGQGNRINTEKRFAFGVHPMFFLALSHKDNKDVILPDASNIDGRIFCIFSDDLTILNFTNGRGFFLSRCMRHYCKGIYDFLYKKEKATLTENIFKFTGGLDYVDPPTLTFSTTSTTSQICNLTKQFYYERHGQ